MNKMKMPVSSLSSCIFIALLFFGCFVEEDIQNEPTALIQYTLTVAASEGGAVSPTSGVYDSGTVMTIIATPDEAYEFHRWLGSDNDNKPNPCGKGRHQDEFSRNCRATITINSNRNIQAFFQIKSE